MRRLIIVLLGVSFAQLGFLAYADEGFPQVAVAENLSELDYIGDVPKVLTVSRLSQPLSDAPSAVTIIDRETIRAAGIVDLPEIFRLVPGMYVGTNAGYVYNTNHVVSYHGMESAYAGAMQILINGRSVYNPLFGGVNWSELPIALVDIERIEVTRGPNAASYGANAFSSVINIITQTPNESVGNRIIATHGDGRNEAFYSNGGKLDGLNYRFTAGYKQDNGLDNRNDFKRTRMLNAQADFQINNENSIELEFGLAQGARGDGNINEDSVLFLPHTRQMSNHYQMIRWRHQVSETSDFSLLAYHNYDRSDDEVTSANLRPVFRQLVFDNVFNTLTDQLDARIRAGTINPSRIARTRAAIPVTANAQADAAAASLVNDTVTTNKQVEMERYDIEAQHNFAIGKQVRVVWGGSARQDQLYSPFYLGEDKVDYFNLQRVFGHVEWQAHEKLTFNAGAMIEHNDFTGTDTSPRASINIKPWPNHTFRLGISTALRTPSYLDEKFNTRVIIPRTAPNDSLLYQSQANKGSVNPERIISRELAYLGNMNRLSVDLRLFHDTINDNIRQRDREDFVTPTGFILLNSGDVSGALNRGGAETAGVETQLKWRATDQTNVIFNYSRVNIWETVNGLQRNFENSMPAHTISALLSHRFNQNWDGSLAYYQTSETTQLGDGDPVDLIRRCDARVARRFKAGNVSGEVSTVVENVFNTQYQEFADYNTLGRRARINVKLDF